MVYEVVVRCGGPPGYHRGDTPGGESVASAPDPPGPRPGSSYDRGRGGPAAAGDSRPPPVRGGRRPGNPHPLTRGESCARSSRPLPRDCSVAPRSPAPPTPTTTPWI